MELRTRLAAAEAELERTLLAGGSTAPVRAILAGLRAELDSLATAAEAGRGAAARARDERLDAAAAAFAAGVTERLAGQLKALAPPPAPRL